MVFRADDVRVLTLQEPLEHLVCERLGFCRGIGLDLTAQPRGKFDRHLIFRHGLSSQSSGLLLWSHLQALRQVEQDHHFRLKIAVHAIGSPPLTL